MKRYGYLVILLLMGAVLSGCISSGHISGSIAGEVRSIRTGQPIYGAYVEIAGRGQQTDHNGRFSISGIAPGAYDIAIGHGSFVMHTDRVTIQGNRTTDYKGNYAFHLVPSSDLNGNGVVAGYIYIRSGSQLMAAELGDLDLYFSTQAIPPNSYEPLEGARVEVDGWYDYTDQRGMFYIPNITPGPRKLTVTHLSLRFPIEKALNVYSNKVVWFGGLDTLEGGIGYYVVIGIDDYLFGDRILPGPVDDAEAIYETLFSENWLAGYGRLLINSQATKNNIRNSIFDAIDAAKRANSPYDYLVIYFSGISGQDILFQWDARLDDWETAITDGMLEDWVRGFPGHVTLIIDGGESATMANDDILRPQAFMKPRYTVIASAKQEEHAYHEVDLGINSVFTHFLVTGLRRPSQYVRPAADLNMDGNITALELFKHIRKEMALYDIENPGRDQEPHFWPGDLGDTVIYRY